MPIGGQIYQLSDSVKRDFLLFEQGLGDFVPFRLAQAVPPHPGFVYFEVAYLLPDTKTLREWVRPRATQPLRVFGIMRWIE